MVTKTVVQYPKMETRLRLGEDANFIASVAGYGFQNLPGFFV